MKLFPFRRLRETKYIRLSPRQCQGCWECVEICPEDVFVKSDLNRRSHVHIKDPDACTGCKKCVRACEYQAIDYIYVSKSSQSTRQNLPGDRKDLQIR